MKRLIIAILVLLGLSACGQKDYYAAIEARDNRQMEADRKKFEAFTFAMVQAAETESATDDIAIAMAYGAPSSPLMPIAAPDTAVDYLRAATPWLSLGLEGYRTYANTQQDSVPSIYVGGDFDLSGQNRNTGDGNTFTQTRNYVMPIEEPEIEE